MLDPTVWLSRRIGQVCSVSKEPLRRTGLSHRGSNVSDSDVSNCYLMQVRPGVRREPLGELLSLLALVLVVVLLLDVAVR